MFHNEKTQLREARTAFSFKFEDYIDIVVVLHFNNFIILT